jgi:AcrR family transcriptional regulator
MARESRRDDLLAAALEEFKAKGYEGTSVTDIVDRLGMSKAAFGYHVESKERLMIELVDPLLTDLEAAMEPFPRHPTWPDEGGELLAAYFDTLIRHRDLLVWVDSDRAVLSHPVLGARLAASNRRMREAIRGDSRSTAARLGASAVLGMLWRPLRNLTDIDVAGAREPLLAAAVVVAETVRSS